MINEWSVIVTNSDGHSEGGASSLQLTNQSSEFLPQRHQLFFLPDEVRVIQELKHTHAEQMNRLNIKHQTECDLLEDLRWACHKRPCDWWCHLLPPMTFHTKCFCSCDLEKCWKVQFIAEGWRSRRKLLEVGGWGGDRSQVLTCIRNMIRF